MKPFPLLNTSAVVFEPDGHHYHLGSRELHGITSTLIPCAYPDTYKCPPGMDEEQWQRVLRNAAERGTLMHQTIELYDDMGAESDMPELWSYKAIKQRMGLTCLASEYLVTDGERFATCIDKVMMDEDGQIALVDLKHTATLHIEEVTLQLSICKRLFELQNPHLKVSHLYVFWLRDEEEKVRECMPWDDAQLDGLFDTFAAGGRYTIERRGGGAELMRRFEECEEDLARMMDEAKYIEARTKLIKETMYDLMTACHVKSFGGALVRMTVVPPTESSTTDTKKLKALYPEAWMDCQKVTMRSGYVKISTTRKA